MTLFIKLAAASVALAAASPASAGIIDLFEGEQFVEDTNGDSSNQGSETPDAIGSPSSGILGGFRDLFVETSLPVGETGASALGTSLSVFNGTLSFSNDEGQLGRGQVVYDGFDGDPTSFGDITTAGLGGVDLTFGIDDAAIFFEVLEADGDYEFSAQVFDVAGNNATFTESITFNDGVPVNTNTSVALSYFTGFGVDVTNVGALVFEIQTTGTNVSLDGSIGSISVVPLPASSLLLLGSVGGVFGGIGAIGRRLRRRA